MISWFVGIFAGVLLLDFVVRKPVSLYIEV